MKRVYICDIVGSGTEDDPYRPAVARQGVTWTAEIPTGDDGRPIHTRCRAVVDADDHTALIGLPGVEPSE